MKASAIASLVFSVLLGAATAQARETTVVDNVLGPEGPLVVDGTLYYVGWISNTLTKWDGKKSVVINDAAGCGHNGLALTKQKTFLIACTNDPGAIIETDLNGKQLRKWDTDSTGAKLAGGINDIAVAANGGAYATVFGPFLEKPTAIVGRVLYLAPGSTKWVEVANDLNYANGVAISPDQTTLYVNETAGNCMLKFSINPDGTLGNRSNFALLNVLTKNRVEAWWIGPDSMKVDSKGNIYTAQWNGAKVLKISPEGKLLHVFKLTSGLAPTNVAFSEGERDLFVSVVKNPDDPKAKGKIVRIANVR